MRSIKQLQERKHRNYINRNIIKKKLIIGNPPLCACGCKNEVNVSSISSYKNIYWNKYCKGHNGRDVYYSSELRQKLSISAKKRGSNRTGKNHTSETKQLIGLKNRLKLIKYVEEVRLNGKVLFPNVGRNEKSILDKFEEVLTFPIIRQYKINGYFLDGYCPMLNIAFEIDEKKHQTHKKYILKDIEKEKSIISSLNCHFIRIPDYGVI